MKRGIAAVLVLLVASCSKKGEPGTVPVKPGAGAPAGAAAPPAPSLHPLPEKQAPSTISLSANGSLRPTLYKGLPLSIAATREIDGPAPALVVRNPSGASASWPLADPVGKGRDYRWTLPAEASAGLAVGVWTLGAAEAGEIEIVVEPAPASPTEAQRRSMFLSKADALLATGKAEDAATLAREEQARAPKDPNPWVVEGDALRQSGKKSEAAARYREALRRLRAANPGLQEQPVPLLRRLAEVEGPSIDR